MDTNRFIYRDPQRSEKHPLRCPTCNLTWRHQCDELPPSGLLSGLYGRKRNTYADQRLLAATVASFRNLVHAFSGEGLPVHSLTAPSVSATPHYLRCTRRSALIVPCDRSLLSEHLEGNPPINIVF